jgi:beta-galactosidase
MMKTKLLLSLLLFSQMAVAQTRREINLKAWEFSRDNHAWTKVNIPHDWAIAGPFDKKWDLQKVAIAQNGETEATEKSGRSGALPWIGEGWYKTSIDIPAGYEAAELVFDGAMSEPRVSINGQEAGHWAYGYNAFRIDATPYLKAGKLDIAVHLQNVEESSRWYPGAGLYRPVKLVLTPKTHIDDWSLYARTMTVENGKAVVEVEFKVVNPAKNMVGTMTLISPDGNVAFSCEGICSGSIIKEAKGTNGFGYDPIFLPDGYTKTIAELPEDEKNRISHRSKALNKVIEYIQNTIITPV